MTDQLEAPKPRRTWREAVRLALLEFALFAFTYVQWLIAIYGFLLGILYGGGAPGFPPLAEDGEKRLWAVVLGFIWFLGWWLFWRHRWQRVLAKYFPNSWLLDHDYLEREKARRAAAAAKASPPAPPAAWPTHDAAAAEARPAPDPSARQLGRYRALTHRPFDGA